MNIFFLDRNPSLAAQYHNDKHVVKMILESCQILCAAYHLNQSETSLLIPYKLTHKNHPSSVWSRESLGNYVWLCLLTESLLKEYTKRYGKVHKSQRVLDFCWHNMTFLKFEKKYITIPPLAVASELKKEVLNFDEVVQVYREYYRLYKLPFSTYKSNNWPEWLIKC